ncbi:EAL domain-containing protein [Sulfurovum sp. zt1-1]|uniref:EAL domain-containing protein n=1 Tax=Sulfurovum zhangzhouensis TaxID=3019067 RepID=A0ABT7QV90_9BACT|nr:EAL domain-containing protein [Sulfurovum zhangzhouensis]MDM5270746.1 EAL domain-containing protein [Sulfurovum zhangzhouensis]
MKQQKYYTFFQHQIRLLVWLSLIPGLVYVFFGYLFGVFHSSLIWYSAMVFISLYGMHLDRQFIQKKMDQGELSGWYRQVIVFMYLIFGTWTAAFLLYSTKTEHNLHYIAIFTQLGAAVVASTLLVSDKKMFVPILVILMAPLIIYFSLIGTWYGYVLSVFSVIFLWVLLYASNNTYKLLETSYYKGQYDSLTGLHNRRYFIEYMESMIERLKITKNSAYVLLIDLDHFKNINDSLGHDVGDLVLKEVANRIRQFCREAHVVSRLGGDEFIVVSKDYFDDSSSILEIKEFAEKLLVILKEPYILDNHHLYISASIGVSKIENTKIDGKSFLKEADIAMYEAKALGRDGVILFNRALANRVERKLLIEQSLHLALKENNLEIYFQPQMDMNQQLVGCEVLSRWEDPEFGVICPNEFIPIAESTGVIIELGEYILDRSLKTFQEWLSKGVEIKQFSINISVRQLFYMGFVNKVDQLMQKYLDEKDRHKIVFEITESVLAEDITKVTKILSELKAIGISLSMDDFGTGYSSLNYLRTLNVDELKIDKTFIDHFNDSDTDQVMVTTIIAIAQNFGLKVVIEGVETQEQFDLLAIYDCFAYQGFYFSKPLSQKEFEKNYLTL